MSSTILAMSCTEGSANGGPCPVAAFEATDAGELRRELECPVGECAEWCERTASSRGRCAEDWVRLGAGIHAAVEMAARAEGMSVDAWIVRALREAVMRVSDGFEEEGSVEVPEDISR